MSSLLAFLYFFIYLNRLWLCNFLFLLHLFAVPSEIVVHSQGLEFEFSLFLLLQLLIDQSPEAFLGS